jgi:hypothetical protein
MQLDMLWNKLGAKAAECTLLAVINLTQSKSLLRCASFVHLLIKKDVEPK